MLTPDVLAAMQARGISGNAMLASRNDADVSFRPNTPQLASAQWPEPDRPSLADRRYLSLPDRPNLLLYYDNTRGDWYRYHTYSPHDRSWR